MAPAANYVALREFNSWYTQLAVKWGDGALHNISWLASLQPSLESHLEPYCFSYVKQRFEEFVAILMSDWQIRGGLDDNRAQRVITQLMKETTRKQFIQHLGKDSAEVYRLEAVSLQSVPTRDLMSDIRPARSHDTNCL